MEKYFKIGEISKLYSIGVDSLRYYEEIGVIKPIRSESGYRLYSIDDIWRLNVIRDLRELGFGMEVIKEYLDFHTVDTTLKLLQAEKDAILKKMETLKNLEKNVEKRMKIICSAEERELNKIKTEEYGDRNCYCITKGYSDEHEMDVLIKQLLNLDKERFYVIGNNQIGTMISINDVKKGFFRYKSVFIMDENGTNTVGKGTYLTVSYKGNYKKSEEWVKKLLEYAKENNFTVNGDILEILWVDIHTTSNEDEHITELQLPIIKED